MNDPILRLTKSEVEEIVTEHLKQQGHENIELFTHIHGVYAYEKEVVNESTN